MSEFIGQPADRVDGRLKVTGGATYSAEFNPKNMAYGVTVQSTITKGRIRTIDSRETEALPGVIAVITYKNSMSLHQLNSTDPGSGKLGEKDLLPLQSDRIFYDGQHVAIVVADTFENAEHGARLLKISYDEEKPVISIEQGKEDMYKPQQGLGGGEVQAKRGDADQSFGKAGVRIDQTYSTPVYHHNPMEPHATIAEWKGNELTIYDSTQSVLGSRNAIAQMLGVQSEKVHLISLFIGGGFGCKGFTWPHSVLAPMAAKHVGRPVKIVLDRMQMFTSNGHRARTIQQVQLGAGRDGKLEALRHITTTETSFVDEFVEQAGVATKLLYDSPHLEVAHQLVRVNKGTPCPTRAPGEAPGTFALEVAMDELAYALKMDPVQLRLVNYAEKNPQSGQMWSAKFLKECYQQGANAIGWSQRNPEPRSMREGDFLVGYGMATAVYPANRMASSARIELFADGHAVVSCATQDIGTGTYTILTQIAADAVGLPMNKIICKLGDSKLPKGPNSGGSQTAASAGSAVWATGLTLKEKAIKLAIGDSRSPLYGLQTDDIQADGGKLSLKTDPSKTETYSQLLSRNNMNVLDAEATTNVSTREGSTPKGQEGDKEKSKAVSQDEGIDRKGYAFQSFGAQFVKLRVDPAIGTVHIDQCVAVMDVGRILNMKTAENQIAGGMIFGIGMALMEETIYDPTNGRVVTRDLANYHVPVNADIPAMDIRFINKPDPVISPVGARGVGEIGITGITAAIVNAIYHATGKRIRELPITPDKLL